MDNDKILEWKKRLESDINPGFDFEFEIAEDSAQTPIEGDISRNIILRYGKVIVTEDVLDIDSSCTTYTDMYEELVDMLEFYIKETGKL